MSLVWINGQFIEEASASVSVRDTGLLHGAGVFTTMRSSAGKVTRLSKHLRRLRDSCDALFVPLLQRDIELGEAIGELLERNNLRDARLRITVTRGASSIDPVHGLRLEPTTLITATEAEPYPAEYYQRGMTVILLDQQKLNPYDNLAGHKTLNYFGRLSALRDATRRGAGEALWFNVHNYLQSGSISNVFIVKAGVLITPPTPIDMRDHEIAEAHPFPRSAVLPGVTRAAVIDLAREQNVKVHFGAIDVSQLLEADEVFLTNSIMDVMPVCRIERRAIGDEKPGPITQALSQSLAESSA